MLRPQVLVLLLAPLVILGVPGMRGPIRGRTDSQLLSDQDHVVRPAPAHGFGGAQDQPLTAIALDYDACRAPDVGLVVGSLLHPVMARGALHHPCHPVTPFPPTDTRSTASMELM